MSDLLDGIKKVGDDLKKTGEDGLKQAGKAVEAVISTTVTLATAPATVAVAAAQGKPVDQSLRKINDVVVDTASAVTAAANTPNFFVVNLAQALGGNTAATFARGAVAGKVIETSFPEILVKYLNKPNSKPEDVVTAPLDVLLAAALKQAADQLHSAAQPIPEMVKMLLRPHYEPGLLDEARYCVGKVGLTLPEVINGTQAFMGNENAVTVPGVIVFSVEPGMSKEAVHWWAHEMQHIAQYKRLGVAGFASEYVKNFKGLEGEAEAKATQVVP